ncbi:MAG: alpha-amylase family glycosyl hydrolase [Elusimicrobia bacterium]|nr:alpha-amylase family glycosyl hydrolase [Elusimicrobiota bacterium]
MRANPHLIEINTRPWLGQMRQRYGAPLTLSAIPDDEWLKLRHLGFDAVWLMGVWQPSPKALAVAQSIDGLKKEIKSADPSFTDQDLGASPYAIFDYSLNPALGQPNELSTLKDKLNGLGMKLFLDFVPNHMALDHEFIKSCPDCFIHTDEAEAKKHPGMFFEDEVSGEKKYFAYGRDPNFPPWIDTVQINHFNGETREKMRQTLLNIAQVCDGVRCDMVMLTLNDVHENTWGALLKKKGFTRPAEEFWPKAIKTVREKHPNFTFVAEVYWGLEWRLQEMGFDYTYDKVLYDRLRYLASSDVRGHLRAEKLYQKRSVRFVENHDETPAVAAFGREKSQAAAVIISTLRGLRLFYHGQIEGVAVKFPVQCLKHTAPSDPVMQKFYRKLLKIADHPAFHGGEWVLIEPKPALENDNSSANILCWSWTQRRTVKLVIVNYSKAAAKARIPLSTAPSAENAALYDELSDIFFTRPSQELSSKGLYVEMPPYSAHIIDFEF